MAKKTQKQKDAELKEKAAKEAKEKEEAAAAEAKAEAEAETSEAEDGDGDVDGAGQHDDEEQDIALIKKMLKDYLGDDHGMDEAGQKEMESLAKEALEGHKAMGKKDEEAYKCAGEAVKLAHHMAKKQAEAKEAGEDDAPADKKDKKPVVAKKDNHDHADDDDGEDDETESESKESNTSELEKKLLEANGRIAALETEQKKTEISRYVETTISKSGLPKSATKRFRETAGLFHSKKDFDAKWKIFQEGMKQKPNEIVDLDFSVFTEKKSTKEDGSVDDGKALDFSDCAQD